MAENLDFKEIEDDFDKENNFKDSDEAN